MQLRNLFTKKLILIGIGLLFFVNVGYLDILSLQKSPGIIKYVTVKGLPQLITETVIPTPAPQSSGQTQVTANDTCGTTCKEQIQTAVASLKASLQQQPQPTNKPQPTSAPVVSNGTKEFYIPFGTGSLTATDWQDVPGLQAYISTTSYNSIKSVLFEVSIHVPTANETVSARLYDVTDKHPVWFSDVFFAGGSTAQLLVSSPITLDSGNKLYQVQMKTQLQYTAFIDQSRIHITTN